MKITIRRAFTIKVGIIEIVNHYFKGTSEKLQSWYSFPETLDEVVF